MLKKYKTGDKIKLKPFEEKFRKEFPKVVEGMISSFGKEHIISGISTLLNGKEYFMINTSGFKWSFNWIEDKSFKFSLPDELFTI